MFLSRNEANSYGSTKSPVGMYCLIKSRQVCKSSMLSPNFTFVNRSLWKPSFKTSCLKIISEQVALMPATKWVLLNVVAGEQVNPAASQRSSQATALTATAGAARTKKNARPRRARGDKMRSEERAQGSHRSALSRSLGPGRKILFAHACDPPVSRLPAPKCSGIAAGLLPAPSSPRPSPSRSGAERGVAQAQWRALELLVWGHPCGPRVWHWTPHAVLGTA